MSQDDLLRGLHLTLGQPTLLSELRASCRQLEGLMLYRRYDCSAVREGDNAWIVLDVPASSTSMDADDGIIFDNFVWMSRAQILHRIKQTIPLATSHIQLKSPLNDQILGVLNQLLAERGIKAEAVRDEFWIERNKNVFKANGISVPVASIEVQGKNAPRAIKQWAGDYEENEFSMALLNWRLNAVVEDAYLPRGYLHPDVHEPEVIFLGQKGGAYPVKIVLRIDSGPLYTFKELRLEGAAHKHEAELRTEWTLKPGAAYDISYGRRFYFSVLGYDWAQMGRSTATGIDCTRIDDREHTVTLTIKVPESATDHALSPEALPCSNLLVDYFFPGNYVDTTEK